MHTATHTHEQKHPCRLASSTKKKYNNGTKSVFSVNRHVSERSRITQLAWNTHTQAQYEADTQLSCCAGPLSGRCYCVIMLFVSLHTHSKIQHYLGDKTLPLFLSLFLSSAYYFNECSSPPSVSCQSRITPCLSFSTHLSPPLSLSPFVPGECHFVSQLSFCLLPPSLSLFLLLLPRWRTNEWLHAERWKVKTREGG